MILKIKIILELFDKEGINLGNLIEIIFIKIGFIQHSPRVLSYILFRALKNQYLINVDFDFQDNEINLNNFFKEDN